MAFQISATPTSFSFWPQQTLSHPACTQLEHCYEHPFLMGGFGSAAAVSSPFPLLCYVQQNPLPTTLQAHQCITH